MTKYAIRKPTEDAENFGKNGWGFRNYRANIIGFYEIWEIEKDEYNRNDYIELVDTIYIYPGQSVASRLADARKKLKEIRANK